MADFSERLKQLREHKGISQQELATYLNVNKQTISGYERGVRRPSGENAMEIYEKIADFFNVDISYLMGLSNVSIRIDNPCENKEVLPEKESKMYLQLSPESKGIVHTTIEKEYNKKMEFDRILALDKIVLLEDAKVLLPDAAAFNGLSNDKDILMLANDMLKKLKKAKRSS